MRLFRSFLTLALVAGGLFATAGRSEAAFSIQFSATGVGGGPASVTLLDNSFGPPPDIDPTAGVIQQGLAFNVGGFRITGLIVSFTDGAIPRIDVSSLSVQNNSGNNASTLRIRILVDTTLGTVTGVTGTSIGGNLLTTGLSVGGTAGTLAQTTATGNATPTSQSAIVGPVTGQTALQTASAGFNQTASLYSLSLQLDITNLTLTNSLVFTGSFVDVSPPQVPAPATLLAAIGCLPVLGFVGALRRRKVKEAAAV